MTMVTITIKLPVEGNDTATNPAVKFALDCLADIMLVQAEDGLYALGSPDTADLTDKDGNVQIVNEYLRGIGSGQSVTVEIDDPSRDLAKRLDQRVLAAVRQWDDEEFSLAFGFQRGDA